MNYIAKWFISRFEYKSTLTLPIGPERDNLVATKSEEMDNVLESLIPNELEEVRERSYCYHSYIDSIRKQLVIPQGEF